MPSRTVAEDIGTKVRTARKQRGLSQEALAYRVGLEQTEISKIERGKEVPTVERAKRIAEVLRLPESDVLS